MLNKTEKRIKELLELTALEVIEQSRFKTKFEITHENEWDIQYAEELDMYLERDDDELYNIGAEIANDLQLQDLGDVNVYLKIYNKSSRNNHEVLEKKIEQLNSKISAFKCLKNIEQIIEDLNLVGRTTDANLLKKTCNEIKEFSQINPLESSDLKELIKLDLKTNNPTESINKLSTLCCDILTGFENHNFQINLGLRDKEIGMAMLNTSQDEFKKAFSTKINEALSRVQTLEWPEVSALREIDRFANDGLLSKLILDKKNNEHKNTYASNYKIVENELNTQKKNEMESMWAAHEITTATLKDKQLEISEANNRLNSIESLDSFLKKGTNNNLSMESVNKKPEYSPASDLSDVFKKMITKNKVTKNKMKL